MSTEVNERGVELPPGANVFVSEIESVLLMHPDVDDAVAVGLRDAEWGRRVHGIIALTTGTNRERFPRSIRAFGKEHLVGYEVPKTFEILDDLGRSESGKVNPRLLAEARGDESAGSA